ncbi:hypothetical protein [Streptomyces cyaneofuscatus]|uniref:hypothetical protein n=1 Tax=Streptomyces cyaneofuscatus TaxID=66883 RepID=UPI0037AA265E
MPEPEAGGGDCFDEGGVDWVARPPTDDRTARMFSTQGRDPGVQVRPDPDEGPEAREPCGGAGS